MTVRRAEGSFIHLVYQEIFKVGRLGTDTDSNIPALSPPAGGRVRP